MNEGWFRVVYPGRNVSCHAEIGVLVNGAGNESGYRSCFLLIGTEDVGERRSPTGCALDTPEVWFRWLALIPRSSESTERTDPSNISRVVEAKNGTRLVERDVLGETDNIPVESASHKVEVGEDECLCRVESNGDNVLGVAAAVALNFLDGPFLGEQVLLVICQHDDKRYIEGVLEPLGELEGNSVTDVDAIGRGAPAGIEEEGLASLISVEDELEVAVREDNSSTQEAMWLLPCHTLEPVQQRLVDLLGSEFLHEFVVVNGFDNAVVANFSRNLVFKSARNFTRRPEGLRGSPGQARIHCRDQLSACAPCGVQGSATP